MLRKTIIVQATVVVGIIIVSRCEPRSCTVVRGANIAVAPEIVFEQVSNSRQWEQLNASGDLDPNAVFISMDHHLLQFGARRINSCQA